MNPQLKKGLIVAAALGVVIALVALFMTRRPATKQSATSYTVGDVRAVHAEVRVSGREVRGSARLGDGDTLRTGDDGRARLRLDDGTLVVVDAATELTLRGNRIELQRGRLFVQGGAASRTELKLGDASTAVTASAAAFERRKGTQIYCAQGELVVSAGARQERVALGETATLEAGGIKVAPEVAFDDWTGGLAVPWAGEAGQPGALPELWATESEKDPGTPLAVRSETIDVAIDGEVATTRARTRYFNGSDRTSDAELRLALPPGAILSRVARKDEGSGEQELEAQLLPIVQDRHADKPGRLEWAGGGALRGALRNIAPGATVDLVLEYVEWLPFHAGRATYRFPFTRGGEPPLVAELAARVDAAKSGSPWLSASAGSSVSGGRVVELRRADARPTGDLVVELAPSVVKAGRARAYLQPADRDFKGEDPFVLVRTEVPELPNTGVSLALVVDTSMSSGVAGLETERAVVDALLQGLSPRDSLVVLAADQTVRVLGSGKPAPVTKELRAGLERELAALRPGGASNLGQALERAADALDAAGAAAGSGMVVYIGDGRASVGETSARDLRRRLARRAGGVPRLGAIATGPGADRWTLARLVAGAGPIYEVADRSEAARVGAALLADALEPTLRDVELDLGPSVDRIYPREARAALAGSTVVVTGRVRGKLPKELTFRFRRGSELVEEKRPLDVIPLPRGADVVKRWAAARIEETAARGDGVEPAIALARQARLLTPWTSWFFVSPGESQKQKSTPFDNRLLGVAPAFDAPFATSLGLEAKTSSVLLEPPSPSTAGATLDEAAALAGKRAISEAAEALRACRDGRAAVRPEVVTAIDVDVTVSPDGHATQVKVRTQSADNVLERCVRSVLESIPFFDAGRPIRLTHSVLLPQIRGSKRTQCSSTSRLPLAVKRGIWQARAVQGQLSYAEAAQSCELPAWRDRRELLELLIEGQSPQSILGVASNLAGAGERDAAAYVRAQALRRVTSAAELVQVSAVLLSEEPNIDAELEKAYRAAPSDEARLAVVLRFLRLAPHSALGRRRLLTLLEAMGKREALVQEIERIRQDPLADAGLLAAGASALRRVGLDDEGRRAFGELIERAPGDPWTLGFTGDQLRAEGLFDEAVAAYDSLVKLMPDDPAVSLRLALAHAGAGRLDVATRLLDRVTQSGGRGDDGRLGELASIAQAMLIAGARGGNLRPEVEAELARRLLQTPLPDAAGLVMVRTAATEAPVQIRLARELRDRGETPLELDAAAVGVSAARIERGDGVARIRLKRDADPGPGRPSRVSVAVLVLGDDRLKARLLSRDVDVPADGKTIELTFNGEALL